MDKNSAIGLTLIALLLLVYFYFFSPAPVPPEVFVERGVDPSVDRVRAQEIVAEWNDTKIREVQRLFGLNRSG